MDPIVRFGGEQRLATLLEELVCSTADDLWKCWNQVLPLWRRVLVRRMRRDDEIRRAVLTASWAIHLFPVFDHAREWAPSDPDRFSDLLSYYIQASHRFAWTRSVSMSWPALADLVQASESAERDVTLPSPGLGAAADAAYRMNKCLASHIAATAGDTENQHRLMRLTLAVGALHAAACQAERACMESVA